MSGGASVSESRLRALAALLLFAATAAVLLSRTSRGVDFTDESFHAALAYRFVLGDVPFRDELAVHQSAALLTFPAVWAFDRVTGGPDGLIRFLRLLHLLFLAAVGAVIWASLRRFLGAFGALLAAALFAVAYPASNPSYNTLGSGFVAASLCLAFLGGPAPRRARLAASGFAAGLATVAYPPLGIWLLLLAAGIVALLPRNLRTSGLLAFGAGAAIGLLPLAVVVASVGPKHVLASVVLTNETANKLGSLRKLLSVVYYLLLRLPVGSAVVAVAFALVARSHPQLSRFRAAALLAALAAACLGVGTRGRLLSPPDWPSFLVALGLIAPLLLLMLDDTPACRAMLTFWAGAAVAGFVTAYFTSSNRENFARSGALVPAIAALWLGVRSEWRGPSRTSRLAAAGLAAGVVALIGAVLLRSQRSVYRDRPVAELTHRIGEGPFAGIRTSRRKYELIRGLQADLASSVARDDFVVFFDDFPAGFLMSRRRPGVCGVWVFTRPGDRAFRRIYVDCVRRMGREPLTAIRLAVDPRDPDLAPLAGQAADPFEEFIARCGAPVVRRTFYEILRLDTDCQRGGRSGTTSAVPAEDSRHQTSAGASPAPSTAVPSDS